MLRHSRLVAKTPLKRFKSLRTTKEKRTGRRNTGPDRTTRELVLERDIWSCVVCGCHLGSKGTNLHHRRNRGAGGSSDPAKNRPSNLLTVCGSGTTGCHGWITNNPAEAMDAGYVVSLNSTDNPADVAVAHARYGLVLLDDVGGWSPVPHIDGGAA